MKKLMIAAAIVCAAAMAQATTAKWSTSGGYLFDGTTSGFVAADTTVYFINATTDADALVKAYSGAGYESTVAGLAIGTGATGDLGTIAIPDGSTTLEGGLSGLKAYYVLFNGDNMYVSDKADMTWIASGTGWYNTDFADPTMPSMNAPIEASNGYQTAGSWYSAAAVPEPTSGLLLLLGVAGLALRRRRA